MAHELSKITSQGQVSVPAKIRKKLGLTPGSILEWDEEGGQVIVRRAVRYSSEDSHNALFKKPPKRKSDIELKDGIIEHIRERYAGD